jgi:hypothetical protein
MPRAIRFASSGEVSAACLVPGAGPVDSLSAHGATSPPESPSELAAFRKSLDRFARYGSAISFDRRERDLSDRVRDVPTSEPARNGAASPSASAHGSPCSPRREPCRRRSTVKLGAGSRVAFDERGDLELKSVLGRWGLDAVAAV